jgi:hypothetical protein
LKITGSLIINIADLNKVRLEKLVYHCRRFTIPLFQSNPNQLIHNFFAMTRIRQIFALCIFSFTTSAAFAQISGVQTIPGSYPTIQAAITALNASGVGTGGATFNIAAGYTETPTASLILTIATNAPTAGNPLIFQKSGAGANPLITAFSPGVSTTLDGIFILNGVDYVTINGIDLQENVANTTSTMQMEWGYALVKTGATNGSSFNTIKNCSVTLNKTNNASVGIYTGNHTSVSTTNLIVTSVPGTSSYNKFYNNTIQNCYTGISITGFLSGAPFDFYDQGNEVGRDGVSANRSQVINFGGAAFTANGIVATNQNNLKIFNTYINSNGGINSTGTLTGIFTNGGTNSNVDIYGDTITLASASAGSNTLYGLNNAMGGSGAGNVVNIHDNVVDGCSYPTNIAGEFRGIVSSTSATYTNIYNNKVTNNIIPGTANFSGIMASGTSTTLNLTINIYGNQVSGNSKTGTAGNFYMTIADVSTFATNVYNNQLFNNTAISTSGSMYAYFNFNGVGFGESMYNNSIHNNTGGTGETIMLFISEGSAAGSITKQIYGNTIYSISGNSAGFQVGGIFVAYAAIANIYNNSIYDITNTTTTGIAPAAYGINITGNVNIQDAIYNNYISEIKAPSASNTNAIYGIWLQGSATSSLSAYYNTVYLNATSTGANFGTAALVCGTSPASIDLRNNILVNASTPNGTGTSRALVRGNTSLVNYGLTSGYNCLYAGTPGPSNLIFADGTNSDQTLQAFKNRVGPREQASFSSLPPFINVAVSPYNLHLQNAVATQCEGGGAPVAGYVSDYDGAVRNASTPDVGADEFSGITTDIASPNILYTLLTNSSVASSRSCTAFATITDPSGINTTIGTRPRIYYKKSVNTNTFNDNTSGTDGWKFVEASNTSSPFSFTINYTNLFGGSVVAGDVIQYFVIAQDLNGSPIVGINNGGLTLQPTSVNLAAANFPLNNTINQYAIVNGPLSGTINVGPSDLITSLTNAGGLFQLINSSVLSGNITVNINGDLTAETGAFALNQWAEEGTGNYSVTIVPSAAVTRNIYGSCAAASLIRFDGADRVTIDGRFAGSGTYLTFRNTSNSAPTIGFVNDAQNNTVQYAIIESGNTSTSTTVGGAVNIGSTAGPGGNDNITISNCEIRDRSDVTGNPTIGIQCVGNSTGTFAQYNNNVMLLNNNIHDWFLLNGASQFGLNIGVGNSGYTISGNSFYQTSARTETVNGASIRAININNTSTTGSNGGFVITNNFIGGSASGANGADMVLGVAGGVSETFVAMNIVTGLIPNSIQNNTIRRIDFTTCTPAAAATVWSMINLGQGIHNVGNIAGNTIGDGATTGSLKITINAGGAVNSFLAGIFCGTVTGSYNIQNNTIAGITIAGTTTLGGIIPQWIQVQGAPSATTVISGNTIGSTTTANSIQNNATGAPSVAFAIRHIISSGAAVSITNNTIQNLTDNSTATSSVHYGILMISTTGSQANMTLTGNTIRDISTFATTATPAITNLGISVQGFGGLTHSISNNTIAGLSASNTGAFANYTIGIQTQGNSLGGTMNQNRIFDLRNSNTSANAGVVGIYFTAGLNWTVNNNMISLSNGANSNDIYLNGVVDFMAQNSALNLNYNSIFISGTGTSATNASYAFSHGSNASVVIKDNIFYNKRSGGTVTHGAIANLSATPAAGWGANASNYNAFIVGDTTKVGTWNATTYNMSGWRSNSLSDANSIWQTTATVSSSALFVNTNNGNLHINTSTYPEALGAPVAGISGDYDNDPRSAATPTIGADELACSVIAFTLTTHTDVTCNGSANGSATVSGTGGNGITYSWSPTGGTAPTATGLAAGTYTCNITNICGNSGTVSVTITQPSVLAVVPTHSNVTCNGASNGTATVSVSGGTASYSYAWTPSGGTGATATGLAAGTYTCNITDANLCTTSQTFNITEPSPLVSSAISQTNVSCNSGSNGSATVLVAGGTTSYSYAWTPSGGTAATASGLNAGVYTCTVTDANLCTASSTFNITAPNALVVTPVSQVNVNCNGNSNGAATVSVSGGTTSYNYAWTPSGGTGTTATGLSMGIYTCTVTDANLCSTSQTFNITEPTPLVASAVAQTNVSCNGGSNGSATVLVSGGTTSYSYAWTPSGGTASTASGLTAGIYTCTVTDANLCSTTQTFNITEPSAISVTETHIDVSCFGGSNGSIDLTVSGGVGPYTFDWNSGTYTSEDLTGLSAGVYNGTLTDANGCTTGGSVTITEPTVLVASVVTSSNPTSCGGTDGAIDIIVSGGTTGYTFLWSNSATTEDITGLSAGAYNCNITDANGCTTSANSNLSDPNAPTVTLSLPVDSLCQTTTAPFVLSGGSPAGGTFSGPGVTAGSFDPMAATIGMNMISYTYTDISGCTGSTVDSIYVDICMDVHTSLTENNFLVFPNPNNGNFTLQLNTNSAADIIIYDALGQLVSTQKAQPKTQQELHLNASGIYLVTVVTADGHRTSQRVVVNK